MSLVSVLIPSYNGRRLLEKHLPAVLKAMRSKDELIIVDDASTDDSWEWLTQQFSNIKPSEKISSYDGEVIRSSWKSGSKQGSVLLLRNTTNQRFAESCNRGVHLASHPLIFLINSDVSPHQGTIDQLVTHFTDKKVFAVGCLEHEKNSQTGKAVNGGKNVLSFQRGMFVHNRATDFSSGETAWASGGSSMFDRQKWLELGGFDQDYYPAYWEDVDLSFRAKKKGWKVLFDQRAEVDHNHETTNSSAFGQKKMTRMSWQHANTFVAKNANWKQKLAYLFWQPYWLAKAPIPSPLQVQILFFGLLISAAILLRFYQLGQVPHGMTWDEAAIGYNGFAIATRGRDEWLTKLPISFKSFGDYKAPLAIYAVGVFERLFGVSLFVIRLPFALSGVLAIVGCMWLTKLIWEEWLPAKGFKEMPLLNSTNAALLSGLLLTTSPWHHHFSRVGFESGIAMSFLIWGMAGIFFGLKKSSELKKLRQIVFFTSAVLLAASLYTYHSSKVVVPLLIVTTAWFLWQKVRLNWKTSCSWFIFFILCLTPLLADSFFGQGGERFQQASIFQQGTSTQTFITTFINHFVAHLQPSYLIQGQTPTLRHGDGRWGVLYPTELLLVLAALIGFVQQLIKRTDSGFKTALFFSVSWVVIGILPSAIGVDVPHSNRMLLALPGFILLAVLGWQYLAKKLNGRLLAPAVLGTLLLIHLFFFVSYLSNYYGKFAAESAAEFKDGYMEAISYAKKYEPEVDKVLFTSTYEQPYIYALLGRQTSPYDYHAGSLIKYEFTDKITVGDLARKRTLIIATPEQLDPKLGQELIYGSDGKIRFVVVKTP